MHVTACFKLIINSYLYLYFVLSSFLGNSWRVGLVAVNVAFEAVWTHCAFSLSPPLRWGFRCKPPHPILLVFLFQKVQFSLIYQGQLCREKPFGWRLSLYHSNISASPFSASCKVSAEKCPDRRCWNSLLKRGVSYLLLLLDCFFL